MNILILMTALYCHSWPQGMLWAGGVSYDVRGCAYPSDTNGDGCPLDEAFRQYGCFLERPRVVELQLVIGEQQARWQ